MQSFTIQLSVVMPHRFRVSHFFILITQIIIIIIYAEISELVLGKVHLTEAHKVVKHITNKHFVMADAAKEGSIGLQLQIQSSTKDAMSIQMEQLSKKYIFFYVAHDLIFKSKAFAFEEQLLESDDAADNKPKAQKVDKFSYIYAIGDALQTWVSHICFDLGETDYFRLNEIVQILDIWETQ